jgi:hypothetical protein
MYTGEVALGRFASPHPDRPNGDTDQATALTGPLDAEDHTHVVTTHDDIEVLGMVGFLGDHTPLGSPINGEFLETLVLESIDVSIIADYLCVDGLRALINDKIHTLMRLWGSERLPKGNSSFQSLPESKQSFVTRLPFIAAMVATRSNDEVLLDIMAEEMANNLQYIKPEYRPIDQRSLCL